MLFVYLALMFTVASVTHGQMVSYCPPGMTLYPADNTCLEYHDESLTFDNARAVCTAQMGDLVMITSRSKDDFLDSDVIPSDAQLNSWHGVMDIESEGTHTYLDGTPLSNTYSPWFVTPAVGESCGARYDVGGPEWVALDCSENNGFTCEKAAALCTEGWEANVEAHACTKVIKGAKKTFNGARAYCQEHFRGDLATSVTTQYEIDTVMKNTRFQGQFWIGVHDPDQAGEFMYIGNSPLFGVGLFKRRTPRNPANQHHCVMMKRKRWYSKNCFKRLFFICQQTTS